MRHHASPLLLSSLLIAPVLSLRAPPDVHITGGDVSLVAISRDTTTFNASQPMTGECEQTLALPPLQPTRSPSALRGQGDYQG